MIVCATCNEKYKAIFEETGQGQGCASVLYLRDGKHYIVGSYGSYVADMRKLELKPDTSYNVGIICDDCIEKLKKDGLVVKEEDTTWT
jgi:hypothetical protein